MIEGTRLAVVVNGSPNGRPVTRPSAVPARAGLGLLPTDLAAVRQQDATETGQEDRPPVSGARCRLAMSYLD
ncbi:hypothetical protein [Kitasatospora sp. GP82]|uniref:hypothetical protein n=1 Tax=Kitasatospora sp. GP82 TaxID=3035089 RepID=UPI002474D8D1|nr:hypothetical protein [Kitasatospora sp. GP82]MDH6125686.1 hypothetical protein [Kitasatospora sp. GP82]